MASIAFLMPVSTLNHAASRSPHNVTAFPSFGKHLSCPRGRTLPVRCSHNDGNNPYIALLMTVDDPLQFIAIAVFRGEIVRADQEEGNVGPVELIVHCFGDVISWQDTVLMPGQNQVLAFYNFEMDVQLISEAFVFGRVAVEESEGAIALAPLPSFAMSDAIATSCSVSTSIQIHTVEEVLDV